MEYYAVPPPPPPKGYPEAVFKEKHWVWDPMPKLTILTLSYRIVDSKVQLSILPLANADEFFPMIS
jgi:hypothetical protein